MILSEIPGIERDLRAFVARLEKIEKIAAARPTARLERAPEAG